MTEYFYNAVGFMTKAIDPMGNLIEFEYDGNENLFKESVTEVSAVAPPRRYTTYRVFDALNRVVRESDSGGNTVYTTYDSRDNVTAEYDENGPALWDSYFEIWINAQGAKTARQWYRSD